MNVRAPSFSEELPQLPESRQLKAGFPWLTFTGGLEQAFRAAHLTENLLHIRVNLGLAALLSLAFSAIEAMMFDAASARVLSLIHLLLIVPAISACLAATFASRRDILYPRVALSASLLVGLATVVLQLIAARAGASFLFPCMLLACVFIYFMGGLIFYHGLAANGAMAIGYFCAGVSFKLPGIVFGYDALALLAVNLFCASVVYMHEKISRSRFLEAALLRELVARDGLTGIQNRRMFDQHIERVWLEAVREARRMAVLLIDIDCFKDYNDRYGHQAGDQCLRSVALGLTQCARRPLDFVARFGGEEFAVVLYEAGSEYVAEISSKIQRIVAELDIPHEASAVARRLTVSIGAACVQPTTHRSPSGLIQLADEALYSAKEQGRNCVVAMESEYHTLRTGSFDRRRGRRIA